MGALTKTSYKDTFQSKRTYFIFIHSLSQTSTNVTDSRVETGPAKTQWVPTTVCASPGSSSRTTTTAWVRLQKIKAVNCIDSS